MTKMLQCLKCKAEVPYEEWKARYDGLLAQGIIPSMIVLCHKCRCKENNWSEK